jgi:hypothetical protein
LKTARRSICAVAVESHDMAYPGFLAVKYLVTATIDFRAIVRRGVDFILPCVLGPPEMAA